jgi:hypothetical protein
VGASPLRRTALFALRQQGQIRKGFTRTEALALRRQTNGQQGWP